jgi:hypothetical protein
MVKKYFNNALQHTHTHTLVIATDDTLLQSLFILVCTKGFEVLVVIDSENHICLFRSIWSKNGIKRDHLQNLNTTTVLYQAVYTNKEQETDRQRETEREVSTTYLFSTCYIFLYNGRLVNVLVRSTDLQEISVMSIISNHQCVETQFQLLQ